MSDPGSKPPFARHRTYYVLLKIAVLVAALAFAGKFIGLW